MSFTTTTPRYALLVTLLATACGSTAGEPDVVDASSTDVARPAKPREDAAIAREAGHTDAGQRKASAPEAGATARPDAAEAGRTPILDASTDRDHGEASATYPAFVPFVPQVQYGGGPVLSNAEIVTITWSGDTNAATFEAFGDDIGASDYWVQTTGEYKVGPASSGPANHLRLPASEAPIASWADTDIATWVVDHVTNASTYNWPAPTANSLYTLYTSPSTDVLYNGSSACMQGVGGYHSSVPVDGQDIAYAVVLQCPGGFGGATTGLASHEMIEAVTDPHPEDITAWTGFDSNHLAWDVFQSFQDEVGDACEFYYDAYFDELFTPARADGGAEAGPLLDAGAASFPVQRTWSNANATLGHAPCRPSDYSVYYNVSPLALDPSVSINLSSQGGPANLQGKGYKVAKGASRTFPVGFYSDGPTGGPWNISASEGNPLFGGSQSSHLTIALDRTQGQNGDIAYVTVTVNAVDTTMNGELVTITSSLSGFHRTFMPILISNE